jgi:hypothetical protein
MLLPEFLWDCFSLRNFGSYNSTVARFEVFVTVPCILHTHTPCHPPIATLRLEQATIKFFYSAFANMEKDHLWVCECSS